MARFALASPNSRRRRSSGSDSLEPLPCNNRDRVVTVVLFAAISRRFGLTEAIEKLAVDGLGFRRQFWVEMVPVAQSK
jgi:hypothetical protein